MRKFSIPKRIIMTMAVPVTLMMGWLGFQETLTTTYYYVTSDKIDSRIKIVQVSDLHGTVYGQDQEDLLARIAAMKPDIILLTGDIIDDIEPMGPSLDAMEGLAKIAPSFYVTGNHEWWYRDVPYLLEQVKSTGVVMVEETMSEITIGDQSIIVSGIGDPFKFGNKDRWRQVIHQLDREIQEDKLSLFLSHRPEEVAAYSQLNVDIVFAGHAHGGQVRIPGLINGLFSPNQGIFPKYAGGDYTLTNGSHLIVSRGMSINERLPRIFNPPEIVVVEVIPE